MRRTLLTIGFFFVLILKGHSQCSYTGTPLTQVGSVNTFCVDNLTTITTGTVNAGQYVVVNVIKGFNYTFSVGNVFNGNRNENLTILNATTNGNVSPSITNSSTSGASITWTATLSGQIKLLLSHSSCTNDNRTGGALTLTLNSIGNTQDAQTAYGTDQWIGHVYNWTGSPAPGGTSPSSPTATYPFTTTNYVGYYPIATETFSEGFGGDTNCISVYSDGAVRSTMYTEQFAVRYRMRSTKIGCYEASFSGDDGVRIYVDGVKIFDEWREQSPTNYNNVLLYLNGNSDIVFDYYENGGQNVANFSLTPFDSGSNTITAPTQATVCSGVAPAAIDGAAYTYNGATVNPTITFQWQSSTNNVTFTDISGATSEDYTPTAITTTTGNVTRYYRRIVSASAATASGCTYTSNAIAIVTSQGTAAVPGTITGTTTQCAAMTGQIYSVTAVANATSYTWTVPTGWAITAGAGTNSITVTVGTAGQNGNISVASTNGCGSSALRTLAVTVSATSVAGTVSANQTICSGASPANITLTGNTGAIQWQSSTDNVSFTNIVGATTTPLTAAVMGTLTATTYFKAIVTSGACSSAPSGTVTVTVNANSNAGTVSANQSICTSTQPANITLTGATGNIQWQVSTNNTTFTNITGATATTLTSAQMGTLTATRYYKAIVTSGVCSAATSATVTVTVSLASLAGTVSANQTICSGATPANITLTSSRGTIQWQSSTNNITFNDIVGANATPLTGATIGALSGTTYYKAVVTNGGCSSVTSATVTITATATAGTVSANQSICTNSQPANITLTGSTGAIQWQSSTNNITFNNITGATASTLTSAQMGTLSATRYYKAVITSGVCSSATSATVAVTVNTASVAGTISQNQTICAGSSPADIVLTGSNGTVQWQSSTNNITFNNIVGATSSTLSSVQMGIVNSATYYKAVVTNGGCSAVTSATVSISIGATTTWNGTAWSNGAPTSASAVVFDANYTSFMDINACTVRVRNNATVVISSGNNITINGALTVDNGSYFTLKTNANLVQNTDVANSGAIVVERITPALMRQDYVMWSTPVDGQALQSFSPETLSTRFYNYNPSNNTYVAIASPSTTNFETGTGYLIRVPNNHPATPATWTGAFTGTPHNGDLSVLVTNGGYNAIGNPYPSAIDADKFIAVNGITEALYFWRKTNNTVTTSYATYTTAGGTSNSGSDPLGLVPNGIIQPCQGFIIKATSPSISFTNTMRINNTNSPFLRLSENRSRIWLNLTSPEGFFGQTLLAYMPTATVDIDPAIDGRFFNDSPTALTSIINDQEFIIQGRGTFDASDIVPLGFKSQSGGTYTIAINNVDGLFAADETNQAIYLKDNMTNIFHDLSQSSYSFATEAGVFNSRFELHYENLLGTQLPAFNADAVVVYKQNQDGIVHAGGTIIDSVAVYDMQGRLILTRNHVNASEVRFNLPSNNQMLLVKIISNKNETVTKKMMN